MNLLRNAAQAIDGAGTITITTCPENGRVRIEIHDTGRGIPPEQIPRLFIPGFSVKNHRVRATISLFSSMNIVQKHGGQIHVTSEPGRSTTFTVLLPLQARAAVS
jgi:signal transduction histidine kinase